jgi:Domain of unknown function (DUF6134)
MLPMRFAVPLLGIVLCGAAPAPSSTETLRFAIMRKGEQIGTHKIELSRAGQETRVRIDTNVVVKVLFVTAYHLEHTASERWVKGQLVALTAATDDNGTHHKVSAALRGSSLEVEADGKTSRAGTNVVPSSLWNPDFLRQPVTLDTQGGELMPISVADQGQDELSINGRALPAHHYVVKGKFSQDVWYDSRGHLIQVKLVVRDGSVISYQPVSSDE